MPWDSTGHLHTQAPGGSVMSARPSGWVAGPGGRLDSGTEALPSIPWPQTAVLRAGRVSWAGLAGGG